MEINNHMNNNKSWQVLLWPIGILISVLLIIMVLQQGYNFKRMYSGDRPQNTISVNAQGKVKATPDTAIVTLGVLAQGKDQKQVADEAARKINTITNFVKSLGVAKDDITTSQSSVNPQYDWQSGTQKITSYQSNQTITVKVRGVDTSSDVVDKILGGAVDNGANQVYGSQFTIDDPTALQQKARLDAIQKAKEKAKELAAAAGIKLGKVVSVEEGNAAGYPATPMYAEGGVARSLSADKAVTPPDVQVGSQDVTEDITLVFEVK